MAELLEGVCHILSLFSEILILKAKICHDTAHCFLLRSLNLICALTVLFCRVYGYVGRATVWLSLNSFLVYSYGDARVPLFSVKSANLKNAKNIRL